jgi:hypothetical protein
LDTGLRHVAFVELGPNGNMPTARRFDIFAIVTAYSEGSSTLAMGRAWAHGWRYELKIGRSAGWV